MILTELAGRLTLNYLHGENIWQFSEYIHYYLGYLSKGAQTMHWI